MSSNLIQNYKLQTSKPTGTKPMPDFDIQRELDNRTFIKPLKGKGKLLSGNILYTPIDMFQDAKYSVKAFKHAASGKANDHELGKLNDIGMMAGGLAIASYLFNKKTTPLTKGMEFVGLGTFFASMAIWPKIAIQLPAYLIHGVNVQKEYQDSFGRKKPFYQDPQFIPWDLYSDKEINAIGNRLGVPQDIPNRRDFIQEKMRKIAIQNNTLWMLTAGFATPIMSALICNQAEPYLLKFQNNLKNKKADKILANVDDYSQKTYGKKPIEKQLLEIFKANADKPLNNELRGHIADAFNIALDPVTAESFAKDLLHILDNGEYLISEGTAKNIVRNLNKKFENKDFSEDFLKKVLPSDDEMVKLFNDREFNGKSFSKFGFKKINDAVLEEIINRVNSFNASNPSGAEDVKYVKTLILNNPEENHPILKALKQVKSTVLDKPLQDKLLNLSKIFDGFYSKNLALDEYAVLKVGAAPETVIANYWNDVSKDLLKIFSISYDEMKEVRFDRNLVGQLLREKIENIAADKTLYDKVMSELIEKVSTINSRIKASDIQSHMLSGSNEATAYEKAVDTVFDGFAKSLKDEGLHRTAKAIAPDSIQNGSAKHIQKAFVEERLLGVKSSFYRLINTLDYYRRAATDPNSMRTQNGQIPREVREELIELCKITSLEGHSSDYATKFWHLRNPHPSDDMSPIEVENGKIKYKYYGSCAETTDIPKDKYFYQNAMNFLYDENLHPDTKAILEKNTGMKDELVKYRQLIMEKLGGAKYFAKPYHLIRAENYTGSDIKFLLTGISCDELFHKAGQQAFNTKKWQKMFGGFGAGLLAVTVFAQFFFGRMKNPDKAGKQ